MNPKSTANLDPKLKEAYERIMGTTIPQASTQGQTTPVNNTIPAPSTPPISQVPNQPVQPAPASQAAPKFEVQEVVHEPISISTPDTTFPPKLEPISNEMVQSPQMPDSTNKRGPYVEPTPGSASNMMKNTQEPFTPKKKGKLMPVVLTLGGLVFFVLYGVIWAKVFNLF